MLLDLLVVLLLPQQSSAAAPVLNPAYGVVLPESSSAPLRRPQLCNRAMPWPIEGTWTPDAGVIARLEARLAPALKSALDAEPASTFPKPEVAAFYRQYLGFIVAGRRIVYVNAAHEKTLKRARPDEWKTVAWSGCDGGLSLFGAEYDPATDTIRNLTFNGGRGRGGVF
jgi:hypothetical protein